MPESALPHHHTDHKDSLFLRSALSNVKEFGLVSELFGQLSDPTRIRIFWMLCHCEECVINIAALVGMTSPAVSHHLRLLKAAGLLETKREGKEVYYRAAETPLVDHLHKTIETIAEISCPL